MSVATGSGTMLLSEVRARAAAALAPAEESDPDVLMNVVDSVDPPALMLVWGEPWLTPRGVSHCTFDARFVVLCIASRVEPGPGVESLEQLVAFVLERLQADTPPWPAATVGAPGRFPIGGVPYIGAPVEYDLTVSL